MNKEHGSKKEKTFEHLNEERKSKAGRGLTAP